MKSAVPHEMTAQRKARLQPHERVVKIAHGVAFGLVVVLWQAPWSWITEAGFGWSRDVVVLVILACIGLAARSASFREVSKSVNSERPVTLTEHSERP
jgi:hypothetical protein